MNLYVRGGSTVRLFFTVLNLGLVQKSTQHNAVPLILRQDLKKAVA